MTYGKMTPIRTRTQDGRRVDTWTYTQADAPRSESRIEIEVYLHAKPSGMVFEARSRHPLVGKRTWENSDINELRQQVEQGINELVEERASASWTPSIVLETNLYTGNRDGESVELRVKTQRVKAQNSGSSNRGVVRAIVGGSQKTLVECVQGEDLRSRMSTQDLPKMDQEDLALMHASDGPSRVVLPATEENEQDTELLKKTIKVFSRLLTDAAGPSRVEQRGVPTGDRLVTLMKNAVAIAEDRNDTE